MSIKTEKFERKPIVVDAVQVTDENMADVAKWCKGRLILPGEKAAKGMKPFIKVKTHRPLSERQTTAFVGDWVLAYNGYKVYTPVAFEKAFRPATSD